MAFDLVPNVKTEVLEGGSVARTLTLSWVDVEYLLEGPCRDDLDLDRLEAILRTNGISWVDISVAYVTSGLQIVFVHTNRAVTDDDHQCRVAGCDAPADQAGLCDAHTADHVSCDVCFTVAETLPLKRSGRECGGWYVDEAEEEAYCPAHRGNRAPGYYAWSPGLLSRL